MTGLTEWFGQHRSKPLVQAVMLLLSAMLLQGMVASYGFLKTGASDAVDVWMLCPAMMLLYIIYNTVRGFSQQEMATYYSHSIYGILLFLAADVGWCMLLTGKSIEEVGPLKGILFVFGIVYLVFLSILNLIRFIMQIVMRQDTRAREESERWLAERSKTGERKGEA